VQKSLNLPEQTGKCYIIRRSRPRLSLSSAAYVLVQALRRMALGGTELAEAQVGTIRLKLFKVAARVGVTVRRVVFHLSSSYPYQAIFREVSARVMGRSPSPAPAPG
jgi:hypothetical protein